VVKSDAVASVKPPDNAGTRKPNAGLFPHGNERLQFPRVFFLADSPKICFVTSTTFRHANPQHKRGFGTQGLASLNRLDNNSREVK
jgi:hypothetical protein